MADGYRTASLADLDPNPEKPGDRREISTALEVPHFNYNVATLEPHTPLAQSGYHYHENQQEFYHVIEGRCRVETEDGSFDLGPDEFVVFDPGVRRLLHNPFDEPCRVVAVGAPPEGRFPVHEVQSYEELLADRYESEG